VARRISRNFFRFIVYRINKFDMMTGCAAGAHKGCDVKIFSTSSGNRVHEQDPQHH